MNSPDVVAALRAGAPDAAGKLYDAHAEGLFQYCWLVLRSREKAQLAMRDTVVLADARIDELTDPLRLKAWLFAIARAECDRHCPGSAGESDEPVARPQQRDAALRIMAWKSVISLPADEREALDLVTRHEMTPPEVAVVLGLPAAEAPALIATARGHLEQALAAEILINRESQECAGRADALQGWTGTVTPAVRERLLRHAGSCRACAPRLPRNVSAAKIFGLVPQPVLTEGGWAGVLSRLSDPDPADAPATAEVDRPDPQDAGPPELPTVPPYPGAGSVPVRDARPAGPPRGAHPRAVPGGLSRRRRGKRLYAGIGAAVAAVGVAAVLAAGIIGGHAALTGSARDRPAAADGPAQAVVGRPFPQPDAGPATPGTSRRPGGPASLAVSAGGSTAAGNPGSPGQASNTSPALPAAHGSQPASNIVFLLGRAAAPAPPGGSPQSPGPSASPVPDSSPSPSPSGMHQPPSPSPSPSGRHRPPSPSPSPSPSGRHPSRSPSPSPSPSVRHRPPSPSPAASQDRPGGPP